MNSIVEKIRFGIQMFMIFLAAFLFITGIFYFNILFIIASLVLALLFGRLFCGWLCPLGFWTERIIGKVRENRKLPDLFKTKKFRYLFTAFFLIIFIYLWFFFPFERFLFPLLLMTTMFGFATILGIFTFDKAWCAYICPWGVLSSLLGRYAPYQLGIKGKCEGCKACVDACPIDEVPLDAVKNKQEDDTSEISSRCIRCLQCSQACPNDSIDIVERNS